MWVLPVPLLPTAITFSRRWMYSHRASSITRDLFTDGMAGKSKVSKLLTAGNRAARIRRSTMRWWRSMSSSSARRSRYWGWFTPSAAHRAAIFPYSRRKLGSFNSFRWCSNSSVDRSFMPPSPTAKSCSPRRTWCSPGPGAGRDRAPDLAWAAAPPAGIAPGASPRRS